MYLFKMIPKMYCKQEKKGSKQLVAQHTVGG